MLFRAGVRERTDTRIAPHRHDAPVLNGKRLMHAALPIPGKRDSDWSYAWIPVIGPIFGALAAAGLVKMF